MSMKIFCVCVQEAPQAITDAKAHFEAAGVGQVDFINCINAQVAGLATSHCYNRDHPGTNFRMGSKPTGIWLAHWTAWQVAMQWPDDHIMILETDAKFEDGWQGKLSTALSHAPSNFDFLFPGSCCCEGHPRTHIKGDVYETKAIQCTHCYIIRRAAIPFMLKTMRKIYAPVDVHMQDECFPHLRTYAILPRIVSQFNTVLPP